MDLASCHCHCGAGEGARVAGRRGVTASRCIMGVEGRRHEYCLLVRPAGCPVRRLVRGPGGRGPFRAEVACLRPLLDGLPRPWAEMAPFGASSAAAMTLRTSAIRVPGESPTDLVSITCMPGRAAFITRSYVRRARALRALAPYRRTIWARTSRSAPSGLPQRRRGPARCWAKWCRKRCVQASTPHCPPRRRSSGRSRSRSSAPGCSPPATAAAATPARASTGPAGGRRTPRPGQRPEYLDPAVGLGVLVQLTVDPVDQRRQAVDDR